MSEPQRTSPARGALARELPAYLDQLRAVVDAANETHKAFARRLELLRHEPAADADVVARGAEVERDRLAALRQKLSAPAPSRAASCRELAAVWLDRQIALAADLATARSESLAADVDQAHAGLERAQADLARFSAAYIELLVTLKQEQETARERRQRRISSLFQQRPAQRAERGGV